LENKTTATEQPRVMVQAIALGFYRNQLVPRGTTFALLTPADFTDKWMRKAAADAPDQLKAADPRRASRPGERPAVSVFEPLPAATPAKPGDGGRVADQSVI
jgi:hypothetical protein